MAAAPLWAWKTRRIQWLVVREDPCDPGKDDEKSDYEWQVLIEDGVFKGWTAVRFFRAGGVMRCFWSAKPTVQTCR